MTDGKVTLVWRTDAHLSDEPPQSRTDDWAGTVLDKIVQVGKIAKEVEADGVLDGGDLFNLKSPVRNSHALVQRVTVAHKDYTCPVFENVGNHDVKYGDLDYLSESPLGVLYESGVLDRLYDEHEAVFKNPPVTVRVVGVPYHGTQYDMNRFTSLVKGKETWLVAVVHCLASSGGGTMYEGEDILKYADLANLAPDLWCFAHWHKNQGVQKIGKKWFVNVGSISRGALTQDEMDRKPVCAVLRFTEKEIACEQRLLKVRPAAEVFNVAGRARAEARDMTMEAFVDNLQKTLSARTEGSLIEVVRNLNLPPQVKERTIQYLEQAGAN